MRAKITFVVTAPESIGFFRGQLAYYVANGLDVEMVSAPGPQLVEVRKQGATPRAIPMEREVCIGKDAISLWRLWRLFRRTRPDLVVSGTPKAGLLGTLAAQMARVQHVVYTSHGLRMETASGSKRRILWLTTWLSCHAADRVLCVSRSLMQRFIDLGLISPDRIRVVGPGTSNGVDVERWHSTPAAEAEGRRTRAMLGIPETALLIGFVGRLVRDKGVMELYAAFSRLRSVHPNLRLLLVGDFEKGDPVPAELRQQLKTDHAVTITGFVPDTAPYYWAMDVLALPTYREGFPGVPLEAQAASVPVVTTAATGAIDAIVDGVTGIRVPAGDVGALTAALGRLLGDAALRMRMGESGSKWVQETFEQQAVWRSLLTEYRSILEPAPRLGRHPRPARQNPGRWTKSVLDRGLAALALLLSAPVWVGVAVAIRLSMGSPVFFRQVRPGLKGRGFTLLKFRTMREARDTAGRLLPDAARLTGVGRLIRSLSLDELPQLWNVLRGEMSLVGPRPLLMEYLERYTPEQSRRHEVLPGITGWAQVNGRNSLGWEAKFRLDLWYVDHWSLGLDRKILWLTLLKVIRQEGISQSGHATMPEFFGSPAGDSQPRLERS
jgi:lipopolysaccharide/colanic/teichoic acid biosynthesis glycosyltransferase/glycosyltransferase involved in cell wall biosynthesis